jgi:TonB family protein
MVSLPFIHTWHRGSATALSLLTSLAIVGSALAETLPDMHPALIGSGKEALINLIDTQKLMKNGQRVAAVMFRCSGLSNGRAGLFSFPSVTPGGERLRDEVRRCLYGAVFIPAVYNHQKVTAGFFGTAMFRVVDGKPRLRIFANQERSELATESDFIAPQLIAIPSHHYDPVADPRSFHSSADLPGSVEILLNVDASGRLKDLQLIKETPPGSKFSETALKALKQASYLPAFRNGKPVDSTTHIHFLFGGGNSRLR